MNAPKIDKTFFDTLHDRTESGCAKYGAHPLGLSYPDIIPMWVADMDFKVPPAVEEALASCAKHGIFGYGGEDKALDLAVTDWYARRMGFYVKPEWIVKTPGVIFAISMAIRAMSREGDAVMICQPVYYPFAKIIPANGRRLVVSELSYCGGRYEINFSQFEENIVKHKVKIFLLCSPHNPVGRVWTKDELLRIAEICLKHGVYIISDEIHSDFVYAPNRHIPIASLSGEISQITVTCTAPSKTFNLAGLQAANTFIENDDIRKRVSRECLAAGYSGLNTMASAAEKAAYTDGEAWLNTLISYLADNVTLLSSALLETHGKITLCPPEGTYLMWLDCRALSMNDKELEEFFIKRAGLYLNSGYTFGAGGSGFMRMNIACPKETMKTALERLTRAVSEL